VAWAAVLVVAVVVFVPAVVSEGPGTLNIEWQPGYCALGAF